MNSRLESLHWVFIASIFGTACGADDAMEDLASTEPMDESGADTSCPPETPPFDFGPSGLSAVNEAAGIKVYLDSASARPPYNDYNDWTIALTDLEGNLMPEAQLTWACAFMERHGHGSNPKVVNKLGDGRYELMRQNMGMQGGWVIRLWVDPTGEGELYEGGGSGINRTACSEPTVPETLSLAACVPRKRSGS
jgi:hypothetical protein